MYGILKKIVIMLFIITMIGSNVLFAKTNGEVFAESILSKIISKTYEKSLDKYFKKSLDNLNIEVKNAAKKLNSQHSQLTKEINSLSNKLEYKSAKRHLESQLKKVKNAQKQLTNWSKEYYKIAKQKASKVRVKRMFKKFPIANVIFEAYNEGKEAGGLENFEKEHPSLKILTNKTDTTTEILDSIKNIAIGTITFGTIDSISFDPYDDISLCDTEERTLAWLNTMKNYVDNFKGKKLPDHLPDGVKQYLDLIGKTVNKKLSNESFDYMNYTIYQKKEDPNKEKLVKLKVKDKELKDKIKTVKKEEKDLKSKNERLRRIRDEKRAAFDRVKSAEKGSDEYNYAKNRFFELSRDYRALNSEIDDLISSISRNRSTVETMQQDITAIASSLENTIDDYNNDAKIKIATEEATHFSSGNLWLGSMTFNSEDRLAGGATKLRYWGGKFDQTVEEAVQYSGGGPIFNGENSYLVDNGKITSFAIGHGENTATDNTKEFHIFDNEIDKTSSFFDQNINTLKLERQLPDGETLSIRTTGHYDYSAWGEWGQTGGLYTDINGGAGIEQKSTHNTWQAGQRTQDLPAQGSATYSGVVNGHYYQGSVGSDYGGVINGTMNMTVDFTNTSIVSGTLNLQKQNGSNFAIATMDEMQINRADSGFAGRLVGVDIDTRNDGSQNMVIGQFNGPNAEEVSGIWNITNTNGEFASGSFAGER